MCEQSNTIIDGHHRYFALKELGLKKIPVTFINYFSEKIKTDSSMLVFPEPFLPKNKFIPGDSCKSTFLKHLKLLIEIFVKDTFR